MSENNFPFDVDELKDYFGTHKRGRPSAADQLRMEKCLRYYFKKDHSAKDTSKITGYDHKTVSKYFAKLHKKINDSEEDEFIDGCKTSKKETIKELDERKQKLCGLDDIIDTKIQDPNNTKLEKWIDRKIKLSIAISNIVIAKNNLVNTPLVDFVFNRMPGRVS
ncbi:MAG: hypothetical protein ACRD90_06220 [Nitrosopumilaceae archaeon]